MCYPSYQMSYGHLQKNVWHQDSTTFVPFCVKTNIKTKTYACIQTLSQNTTKVSTNWPAT